MIVVRPRGQRWSGLPAGAVVVALVSGFVFVRAPASWAATSATPDNTYVTNGTVDAVARTPSTIYLAGRFSQVGPRTGAWVTLSASTGKVDAAMPHVSGGAADVNAIVSDGSGGFYIGGNFTHVGGLVRHNLAHIRADGSVDLSWRPSTNGNVDALALSGPTVYFGGSFTSINGSTPRNYAAAVDATTGAARGWNPNANSFVEALAVFGSKVYLGGLFTSIENSNGTGTVTRDYAAAVDAANGFDTGWDPHANGDVLAIGIRPQIFFPFAKVYLGGSFTSIANSNGTGTVTRNHAAAVDSTSGYDIGWNPNVSNAVFALAVAGSTVYLGGSFNGPNSINGSQTRNYVAAVDATTGTATAWDVNANGLVDTLAVSGSTVYLGGRFTSINGSTARNYIAAVDGTNGTDTGWNPNANYFVLALATFGQAVAAGGQFSSLGGQPRNNVAALNAADGTLAAWNPNANSAVEALAVSGSTVYLGGGFTSINGSTARNNAAAVDATTGAVGGWNPNPNAYVDALAVSGSTVYLGGGFTSIENSSGTGTVTRNRAAAVDATNGYDTGWNPNANFYVAALALSGSTVYLGGGFNGANSINGSLTRNYVAAVNATTGTATAWDPNVSGGPIEPVAALAVSHSTVYIGGTFSSINGSTVRNNAAAVDAITGVATGWNPNVNFHVLALAASGSTVYMGGDFSLINGSLARNSIAAVDATTGTATAWDPNANGTVDALAVDGAGGVLAGGAFTSLDLVSQQGVASFSAPPSNTGAPHVSGTPRAGKPLSCSTGSWSGSLPLSFRYRWLRDGAPIAHTTRATHILTPADAGHALACQVKATNLGGHANATSAAVNILALITVSRARPPVLRGSAVLVTLICQAPRATTCTGRARLTTVEKRIGQRVIALSARTARKRLRAKRVTVGSRRFSITGSKPTTIKVSLNALGKRLLARFGRLPATLTISLNIPHGKPIIVTTKKLDLKAKKRRA